MGRQCLSFFMQRAIRGDCVAWNPLMAPQAILTNIIGKMGEGSYLDPIPSHISGNLGELTNSIISTPKAMNSKAMANTGYMRPIILSIGRSVANT